MKNIALKKCGCLVLVIILALSCLMLFGCTPNNEDYSYLVSKDYIPTDVEIIEEDNFKNAAIKLKTERDIKVLQLTDIHFGNGALSVKKDKKAFEAVCALIENAKPDLIVLTGDIVYPNSFLSGSSDNKTAIEILGKLIEKYKTPWTICFGNHDAESNADYGKEVLCNLLESNMFEYCLFSRGPSNIGGLGNHVINVYNADNSFNSSLFMFDNGEYSGTSQLAGYLPISEEQVNWYKNQVETMSLAVGETIQSFAYFHVPIKEYATAWELYKNGDASVKYFYGAANEASEKISTSNEEGSFFSTAVELGSTKAMFCGHNHLNDFSVEYQGIRLTFGKSIDYLAYFLQGIANKSEQRGSTTLVIKGKNSNMQSNFEIFATKLTDIQN